MKPEAEKQFRKADELLREIEHFVAGGMYRAAIGRTYLAMFHAATAALLEKEIDTGARQATLAEFNDAFVKTGLIDKKYYDYFRQAYNMRTEPDSPSFASADHRQAQSSLLNVKDFIEVCRKLTE
jgi:uncharacterized protein (UPF0332 family)